MSGKTRTVGTGARRRLQESSATSEDGFESWLESLRRRTVGLGALERICRVGDGEIWMRRFWDDPEGSDPLLTIKRIPAWTMLSNGVRRGLISQETSFIVTASSGNFLYELAIATREISKENGFDLHVLGFVPRRIPENNLELIRSLGVNVVKVETEEDLCPREATVMAERRFAARRRDVYNADQYIAHENPLAHQLLTAQTIFDETGSLGLDIETILVPTGTGGTMNGLSSFFKTLKTVEKVEVPEIAGVQPTLKHHILGVHHITIGEGCRWNPETYSAIFRNAIFTVDDVDAYAGMLELHEKGIPAGPSTGLAYHQAKKEAEKGKVVLITSADSDIKYYGWTLEILKGRIGEQIVTRYPAMEEIVSRGIERFGRRSLEGDVSARFAKRYHFGEKGAVLSYEEFLERGGTFP